MGFTGLARCYNAPPTRLQEVKQNILTNHNGQLRGKWYLSIKSFRSTFTQASNGSSQSERMLCAVTMDDNVFVLLDDPAAPGRADVLAAAPAGQEQTYLQGPSHFRTTFLTLRPPGALEQLLTQLKAPWVPVRQAATTGPARGQASGQQLIIDGFTFAIGTDWIVRVGNVVLAGGLVKGMLLEAEYLPVPILPPTAPDGTTEILSNLLLTVLPNHTDTKTVAVTISDTYWQDVLLGREEDSKEDLKMPDSVTDDEVYAYGFDDIPEKRRGDWVGIERDRRSAFLIMGALRQEGIL